MELQDQASFDCRPLRSHTRSSRPSKPVETMLNRFTQYALPFHLETIHQHRMNIEKVRKVYRVFESFGDNAA